MEAVEKIKKLEKDLNEKIKNISPKFVKTRRKARMWKIFIVSLGIITTITLGIKDIVWGNTVGFILSAILTGVTAIEGLYNHASKSVQEHEYYVKLTDLKQDIEFYKEGKALEDYQLSDVKVFFEEFKRLRTDFHNFRVETVKVSYGNTKDKSN
ncbi:SLATT domain-containing protein [Paenibacillus terrigena]|uniref:SLATT domain-containing protein n=1 Tax=Paenibacillus terrigena TaxID=369333 RepID=UPI000377AC07|nr:SLATT domain-containing protein [Paenibacillus terrigena]